MMAGALRGCSQRRWRAGEEGTGLIGSTAGILVFVLLLLLAVQVLFDLYARSAVTAATFDAARVVAGVDSGAAAGDTARAEADAEGTARRVLGRYGDRAKFLWSVDADTVALSVQVHNPSLLPSAFSHPLSLDTVARTVRLHRERL